MAIWLWIRCIFPIYWAVLGLALDHCQTFSVCTHTIIPDLYWIVFERYVALLEDRDYVDA